MIFNNQAHLAKQVLLYYQVQFIYQIILIWGLVLSPSPTAGVKLTLKANDSSNDPTILLEAFGAADSATIGWKNPDVRWNLGLAGGSSDSFVLQNQTTNKFPILIDYSSSDASIVLRNDNGSDLFQKVGINWPYGEMGFGSPNHTLLVSGSVTSSVGFYGDLIGTASVTDKAKVSNMIANQTNPVLVMPGTVDGGYKDVMADPLYLNFNNITKILETTASWATESISASYSETASYALTAESANPLWYDGGTYISSSYGTIVSGSTAEFVLYRGGVTNTSLVSSSAVHSINFSGSNYTASSAVSSIVIGSNII